MKAVVLLSGGIDSSTTLAMAKADGYMLHAISFDYNQRHRIELASAKMVANALNVKEHLIVNFDLREIGGSALTSDMGVPTKGVPDQGSGAGTPDTSDPELFPEPQSPIPVTYVPARNTIFLSFALAWAEVLETGDIFIGANAVDYSGYPDCRAEYLRAFEDMSNLATKASVEGRLKFSIKAPLISMKKAEIIKKGIELGLDYSLTWSCYDPQPKEVRSSGNKLKNVYMPCGLCDSCRIREKGFIEAGIEDAVSIL